ncbi:hypothetical protein DXV76_09510 [Rhodobacteraceae bacterium CCMM004]|nr:hypothetical protein DXV76_09510 [Rhodobacteraceae bacterium CCMM004]
MTRIIFASLAIVSLAGCQASTGGETVRQSMSAPWLSIVDKTLVSGESRVVVKSDGTVVGTGIRGTWEERDGRYCRTLTEPARFAGTECQVVTLNGNQVSFDNQMGRVSTWTVQ